MNVLLFAIFAILCYLASSILQWRSIGQPASAPSPKLWVKLLGAGAIIFHTLSIFVQSQIDQGFNLAFFQVGSLIALVISALLVLSSLGKPVENLFIGLFPMSSLFLAMSLFLSSGDKVIQLQGGLGMHIILAIISYSILLIASVQAAFLYVQDQHLRSHQFGGFIRALPPLQTMDRLLFEMIWLGTILLTLSFVFGWPHVENIKEQQLIHKTALSIVAWLVFVVLLVGRYAFGWRGIMASKWAISGTVLLVLAYFGSKFALEFILS